MKKYTVWVDCHVAISIETTAKNKKQAIEQAIEKAKSELRGYEPEIVGTEITQPEDKIPALTKKGI